MAENDKKMVNVKFELFESAESAGINWNNDNSVNVSCESGKLAVMEYNQLAVNGNGTMPSDILQRVANLKVDNIAIKFDIGKSYNGIEYIGLNLNRAWQTIGTYSTRCNKIARGLNPDNAETRVGKSTIKLDDIGISLDNENQTLVFHDAIKDYMPIGKINLKLETIEFSNIEYYGKLAYYADAIIESINPQPNQTILKRLRKLIQLVNDENGKLSPCIPETYIMKYGTHAIELETMPNNETLLKHRLALMAVVAVDGKKFDANKIMSLEFESIGGNETWLHNFLELDIEFQTLTNQTRK